MKRTHRHVCDCGDWLTCSELADQCAVPEPYECQNCLQRQLDAWAEIEMRRQQARDEETDYAHHR